MPSIRRHTVRTDPSNLGVLTSYLHSSGYPRNFKLGVKPRYKTSCTDHMKHLLVGCQRLSRETQIRARNCQSSSHDCYQNEGARHKTPKLQTDRDCLHDFLQVVGELGAEQLSQHSLSEEFEPLRGEACFTGSDNRHNNSVVEPSLTQTQSRPTISRIGRRQTHLQSQFAFFGVCCELQVRMEPQLPHCS